MGGSTASCLLLDNGDPCLGTVGGEGLRRAGTSGALLPILSIDIACSDPISGVCDLLILAVITICI